MSCRQSSPIRDWFVLQTIKSNQRLKCLADNQVQSETEMSCRHLRPCTDWFVLRTKRFRKRTIKSARQKIAVRRLKRPWHKSSKQGRFCLQDNAVSNLDWLVSLFQDKFVPRPFCPKAGSFVQKGTKKSATNFWQCHSFLTMPLIFDVDR